MTKPDFLIIGAAKSGTTSLYFYLQQHPRIFLPIIKEPFFFAFENHDLSSYHYHGNMKGALDAVTNSDDYQELFSLVRYKNTLHDFWRAVQRILILFLVSCSGKLRLIKLD